MNKKASNAPLIITVPGLTKGSVFYTEWFNKNDSAVARMLFDHSADPGENLNISEKKDMQDEVNKLSAELKKKRGMAFIKE